ncbi:MAG: hypothetical protein ACI4TC_07375 [Kiritimatiellia bacterium]
MAFSKLKDDFTRGPVSMVPFSWFNRVAKFINGLIGGMGIKLTKNIEGNSVIEVDTDALVFTPKDANPTALKGANISSDATGQTYLNQSAAKAVVEALSTKWTRGEKGIKLTVCTGVTKNGTNATYYAHFADLVFDERGMLLKVETAKNWFRVI